MVVARKSLLGFLFLLLAGCATPPEGPPYLESKAQAPKPGHALVYIFREYAEPTAFAAAIQIDGQEVGDLAQGGFTWIYAKPGLRKITSTWGISGQTPGAIELEIAADKTYYIAVLGQSKANFVGMIGIVPIATIRISSGFVEVPPVISEEKLVKCCKFQRPSRQEF